MPITSAQKKSVKQSLKRGLVNKKFKDDLAIAWRIFHKKVEKKETVLQADVDNLYSKIDKALKRNILHRNTAARRKALIAKNYNQASQQTTTETGEKSLEKKTSSVAKKPSTKKPSTKNTTSKKSE